MKKILFASFNSKDFAAAGPLLKPLAAKGVTPMILRGLDPPDPAQLDGWKSFSLEDFPRTGAAQDAQKDMKNLTDYFKGHILKKIGRPLIDKLLNDWSMIGRLAERVLEEDSPDLVVLSPGPAESAYVASVCERLSKKYCYLLPSYYEFKTCEFFNVRSAIYLVSGEAGRQRLVRRGADTKKILALGNPQFDSLQESRRGARLESEETNSKSGQKRKKNILLALQNISSDEILVGFLIRYLSRHSEIGLIVRPHPSDKASRWTELSRHEAVKLSSLRLSIDAEILKSDVLVTATSISILNALVLGVPALSFKADIFPEETLFAREGDTLRAENYGQIEENLDRILFDEAFRGFWKTSHADAYKKYLSVSDKPSSLRVAEELVKLAGER